MLQRETRSSDREEQRGRGAKPGSTPFSTPRSVRVYWADRRFLANSTAQAWVAASPFIQLCTQGLPIAALQEGTCAWAGEGSLPASGVPAPPGSAEQHPATSALLRLLQDQVPQGLGWCRQWVAVPKATVCQATSRPRNPL